MGNRVNMVKVIEGILKNKYNKSGGILSDKDFTELASTIWETCRMQVSKFFNKSDET